ncbi:MAG: GC-type dockerin domain-anchored protein [Phycisphaerales bacterium JB059]
MRRNLTLALAALAGAATGANAGGPGPTMFTWDFSSDELNGVSLSPTAFTPIGPSQVAAVFSPNAIEHADGVIYANDGANASDNLYTVNPATGVVSATVALNFPTDYYEISGLEWINGVLYAALVNNDVSSSIGIVDPVTGNIVVIGATGLADPVTGITCRNGACFAVTNGRSSGNSELHTVNLTTGLATLVAPIDFGGTPVQLTALEFDVDGTLYALPSRNDPASNQLLEIDPVTGAATSTGLGGPTASESHIALTSIADATNKPTLFGWDTNNFTGGTLEAIDPSVPSSTPVGPDQSASVNFPSSIEYASGVIYAEEGSNSIPDLYTVNAQSGVVINTVTLAYPAGYQAIGGMAWVNNTLYGVIWNTTDSSLATINPNTGAVSIIGPTGLTSPMTGLAYDGSTANVALGLSGGRDSVTNDPVDSALYRVSLSNGSATLITPLTIDGSPITLTALEYDTDGTLYAVPSRLSAFDNHLFRVNVETGELTDLGDIGTVSNNSLTSTLTPTGPAGLYLWDTFDEALWAVDERAPDATRIGPSQFASVDFPAEIEYINGAVFAIEAGAQNGLAYRVDTETGCVTETLSLSYPPEGAGTTALERIGNTLFAGITDSGGGMPSSLATINPVTGDVTTVGATGLMAPVAGLAWDGFTCYAVSGGGNDAGLYRVDLGSGALTFIGTVNAGGSGVRLTGLEFGQDGVLYGITPPQVGDGALYAIDPQTAEASIVGTLTSTGQVGLTSTLDAGLPVAGLLGWDGNVEALCNVGEVGPSHAQIGPDFTPGVFFPNEIEFANGLVYANEGSNGSANFYSINPTTGLVVNTATLNIAGSPIGGNEIPALEQVGNVLYGTLWNGSTSTLVAIDPLLGGITLIGDTGVGAPFGGLMWDGTRLLAMSAGSNMTGVPATIFSIDLFTGDATFVAEVTLDGQNVSLTAAEFGADGNLYASPANSNSDRNHLYRVNPATGVAIDLGNTGINLQGITSTVVSTLPGCNPADLAPPYGTLDFSDIIAFLHAFGAGNPLADYAPPFGTYDFTDVIAFLGAFGAGCP